MLELLCQKSEVKKRQGYKFEGQSVFWKEEVRSKWCAFVNMVWYRISERMSCEESAIFFWKPCIYPPYYTKSLNLFIIWNMVTLPSSQDFNARPVLHVPKGSQWVKNWDFGSFLKCPFLPLGHICKCNKYFWTLYNSFFHKIWFCTYLQEN